MRLARRGLCALGFVTVMLTGCAAVDFDFNLFAAQNGAPGGDRVVAGSLDVVAESTKATLNRLGLVAEVTKEGEAVYISSVTRTGAKFTFVLTRDKAKDGEHTRIHVEWAKEGDEQSVFQILSQLEVVKR